MIFKEDFYHNKTPYNPLLHIRCAGELHPDNTYCIEREDSETGTIMYITSGIVKISYEGRNFSLPRGDSFILSPHKKYVIKSDRNEPAGIVWLNIRGSLFENTYHTLFGDECFPIKTCSIETDIRSLFPVLDKENNFLEVSSRVMYIMLKLYSSASVHRDDIYDSKTLAGQFEFYISECIQNGFSMDDMCDYFNMSKDKLTRSFKESLHTTPYHYYQNLRLDIAKSVLLNSNLTIEEIADRLKFNDRNHFTAFFIKNAGISPAKFRQENEKTE